MGAIQRRKAAAFAATFRNDARRYFRAKQDGIIQLGRYSVTLYRNFKAVKYWLRIICMPNDKLPKLCYKL